MSPTEPKKLSAEELVALAMSAPVADGQPNILRGMVDERHPLKAMALLVRRAGLEHLVNDPSSDELQALADAGDFLALERTAALAKALMNPVAALRPFDKGAAARAETKRRAYALSRVEGG